MSSVSSSEGHDPRLFNEDLAPVPSEKRTWGMWHIAALWVGMCICIPTYQLASGLVREGMSWWQGVLTVLLGNIIVLIPMILNAHAGAEYGIPFPVFARASFGVVGANIAAILRAIVACGWFGIQTWFGGDAIFKLVNSFSDPANPILASLPKDAAGFWGFLGISGGQLLCFVIFWLINVYFIWKGTESIKWMESLAAPFLIVAGLALLIWAIVKVGSLSEILSQGSKFETTSDFFSVFFPGLTAMVGFWATLSLNIPDFTRYARSQREQVLGQAIGLPPTMALFAFIGVAVTAATPLIFKSKEMIGDPVDLMARVGSPLITLISMLALSLATLSTNIAANVVSPANDISNLAPRVISYKMGGYITAIIGFLIMPWKLLATAGTYLFIWLIGYSALLGPIGGIMIFDYFLLRKKKLNVTDLYRRGGEYEYKNGINWSALVCFVIGVIPCLPGFIYTFSMQGAFPDPNLTALERKKLYIDLLIKTEGEGHASWVSATITVYEYAWFVGFLLAGVLYFVLNRGRFSGGVQRPGNK